MGNLFTAPVKEAEVRYSQRAEVRKVAYETYVKHIELATGYSASQPLIKIGVATGTQRVRGDLLAPMAGQDFCLDLNTIAQHLFVLGGTGEGKSSALLRPLARILLALDYVGMYYADAKGVGHKDISAIASQLGRADDVRVIGTGKWDYGVDLMDGLSPTQAAALLRSVMDQMDKGGGKDAFWPNSAALLFRNVAAIFQAAEFTPWGIEYMAANDCRLYSLWKIYEAIINPAFLEEVIRECQWGLADPVLYEEWGFLVDTDEFRSSVQYLTLKYQALPENTRESIVATLIALMDGFGGVDALREKFAMGKTGRIITMREALESKIVVNAVSAVDDGLPASIVSIFCKTLLYRAGQVREREIGSKECQKRPCIVMIDEVQSVLSGGSTGGTSGITNDSAVVNVARSQALYFVWASQTLSAITLAIGKEAADNLMNQFRSVVMLRNEDDETVQHMAKIGGRYQRAMTYEPGHYESVEQMTLLTGFNPLMPVDDDGDGRPARCTWRTLLGTALGMLNPAWVRYAGNGGSQPYQLDHRFLPRSSVVSGDSVADNSNALISAKQQAQWRLEDLTRQWLQSGNDERDVITPADVKNFGRWFAYAVVQRAGITRADIIEIQHDFG